MVRGAKPKPTEIKRLAGNPGKRPLNEREPKFQQGPVTVPGWLDPVARREFRRILRISPERLITAADRGTLAALCALYSRAVRAETMIREHGEIETTTNGNTIQSPWVGMANKAWAEYVRLATEFGLTPSARSRIQVPEEGDILDPFTAYMQRQHGLDVKVAGDVNE